MDNFKEITANNLTKNVFDMLGKDWALLTATKEGVSNTMTISWGGMGVLWHKPVVYAFSRPSRFTKEFIDGSDTFSLTFFDEKYKKELGYLGKISGRDEDKITKSGLTLKNFDSTPYFEEANCVLICKKSYQQNFQGECYVNKELAEKFYPNNDHPTMYIGEILSAFVK